MRTAATARIAERPTGRAHPAGIGLVPPAPPELVQRLSLAAGGWLPPLLVGVPDALAKQAIEVGETAIAPNEKPEPFGVRLARPLAIPYFTAGIVRIEPDAP